MEGSLKDVSRYRLETAEENLAAAKLLLRENQLKFSVNRSYYSIFHAMRAVVILDGFDPKKHSGIIAYFNAHYVKTGVFPPDISKCVDTAIRMREKSDYMDFFVVSRDDAEEQIQKAGYVLEQVRGYLEKQL